MEFEAFKLTIYPVRDKLFRFALRLVRSEEEANDIVQETMIKAWSNKDKMKNIGNPEAWCMTVTKNLAFDRLKSKKKWNTDSNENHTHLRDSSPSPAAHMEMNDTMSTIHEIINRLPAIQQQVIHLRDIEGYSYEEICDILEVKLSQVKVSLHRARKSVRDQLLKVEEYGL